MYDEWDAKYSHVVLIFLMIIILCYVMVNYFEKSMLILEIEYKRFILSSIKTKKKKICIVQREDMISFQTQRK